MNKSLGLTQLSHNFKTFAKLFNKETTKQKSLNIILILTIDITFGILLTNYLDTFPDLYGVLKRRIDKLLTIVLHLLGWLKGSPAGFKLNASLNNFLWRFFSYHLHLWRNYIGILEPILSFTLVTLIKCGLFGITCQIAVLRDILSIATFHVYCLYIYATRLYRVLFDALNSLGRLIIGRKWNPLRNRVDSIQISHSEMFLCSMSFTFALFLAPTIIVYYTVFLSLRLPVLLAEGALTLIVNLYNSFDIVNSFLIIINSPRVSNEIYLQTSYSEKSDILKITFKSQCTKSIGTFPNLKLPLQTALKNAFLGIVLN